MEYTIGHICEILGAEWAQKTREDAAIEQLLLDTRQISRPETGIFFAIRGVRHDGHRYLADAHRAGVRNFVVSFDNNTLPTLRDANVLRVPDTLDALQTLAAHHRSQFNYPVIGITGSNGKTIVKEWLYQLLHREFDIVRSPKSFNSQVGVPLSVWQMQAYHHLAIIEAGISTRGEMARLAEIIQPTIGIFTNIGTAHSGGFDNDEEKTAEKMLLFETADTLFYCADYPLIHSAVQDWLAGSDERNAVSWSLHNAEATFHFAVRPEKATDSLAVTERSHPGASASGLPLQTQEMPRHTFSLPFSDPASLENALHCYCVLRWMGWSPEEASEGIARLEPVEMRLELKAAINRCTMVNDAYSNDLVSLRIALQFARQQARHRPVILVLSDILQSGEPVEILYRQVADILKEEKVASLIGIGADIPVVQNMLPPEISAVFYPDTAEFLRQFDEKMFRDALIVLKGARAFEFERIAKRLEAKAHKTVMEVDLSALVHNLQTYHSLLKPGAKMLVMVKAAGYGAGPAELGRLLEFHHVDYLGVAYTDEGIELRQAGVRLPILVLNPEPSGDDAMYRYQLEPEVYNLSGLESLVDYTRWDKKMSIHLKLDTGMHRLGFEEAELDAALELLRANPQITVQSVFTHLVGSDAAQFDEFTHRQAFLFQRMYARVAEALGYRPIRHVVNTGGIVRFPEYHFDMVRLGIGIYGVDSGGIQDRLRVVNTLKATISQIKELPAGETVGYNRRGAVDHPARIATISIGYADGFLRLAGNGRTRVRVRGKEAPTIGNICMDMCMIDISRVPEAQEGDEVEIFGCNMPVQALAEALQTIPYEVFTNIADRVKRVYWQE